jgi:hypothetical protein
MFFAETLWWQLLSSFLLPEHIAVGLQDVFELPNSSNASSFHRRVQVAYSCGEGANFRNGDSRGIGSASFASRPAHFNCVISGFRCVNKISPLLRCHVALTGNQILMYKVAQIWPGLIVCKQVTVCPGHILTTLYLYNVWILFLTAWLLKMGALYCAETSKLDTNVQCATF